MDNCRFCLTIFDLCFVVVIICSFGCIEVISLLCFCLTHTHFALFLFAVSFHVEYEKLLCI